MKAIFTPFLLIILVIKLSAQGFDPANASGVNGLNKAFYDVVKKQPVQKDGVFYLDENFYISELTSYSLGKMKDVPVRFDLFTNQFEIAIKSLRYNLKADHVKKFSWYNTQLLRKVNYVNVLEVQTDKKIKGFFEVIYEGQASLFFHQEIAYYGGTQSPSVNNNAGSESINKIASYYISNGKKAYKVGKGKKKNQKIFQDHQIQVAKYMKENKLNLKKKSHLIAIVKYYDKLLTQ